MIGYEFYSVPGIGNIMELTGINDGWIVICFILIILAVIFLTGWISSASKARACRKELASAREEMMGLQALTNLPPLHEGEWDYAEGADPGSSLVFASAKELRRRNSGKSAAPKEKSSQAPSEAAVEAPKSRNVTAQVHDAIFASVAGAHAQLSKEEAQENSDMVGNRKRKANGAAITSSDLPPIHVGDSKKKAAEKPAKGSAGNIDASLSSRIPRL